MTTNINVSAGYGFDISIKDPHRLRTSAAAGRRRRLQLIYATSGGSTSPSLPTVQANFTLETQVYRLRDQDYRYESPDGLLIIENAVPLTGSLVPDSPADPAIPISVIDSTNDFLMHTIHQDPTPLTGTGL